MVGMTDKTLAERLPVCPHCGEPDDGGAIRVVLGTRFHLRCYAPWLAVQNADALDAKNAEIARLRKALIRAEGVMTNAAPNGDMRDALLVVRSTLWD